jgi:DNA-binding LacI/PurR family transcriptional regulator
VAHLIRLGHRRIGLLTIGERNPRAEGYRLALQDAGIPYDSALVSVSNRVEPDLIALGRYQTEQVLASADFPTAIFGITDLMAMGALWALKEAGLRVPEDIAVAGFDDLRRHYLRDADGAAAHAGLTTQIAHGCGGDATVAGGHGPEGSTAVPQSCPADRAGDP